MDIEFSTNKLHKVFSSESKLTSTYGILAKSIMSRLSSARAATCLEDLRHAPGKWHELTGNLKGRIAVSVSANQRMVFSVGNNPVPLKNDGGFDWSQITSLVLETIEDYH